MLESYSPLDNFLPKDLAVDNHMKLKFLALRKMGETRRKRLQTNPCILKIANLTCRQDNCDVSCLKIIENATSFYQLKIKESFDIERLKPKLNCDKQVDHVGLAFYRHASYSMFSLISLVSLNFTYL